MEVRDPIHGPIHLLKEEVPIIENPFFQRLRSIKQLGFSEYVFPGATHTRFLHSLGVFCVANRVFQKLFAQELSFPSADLLRIQETFKLACLLHDVGHAPLSHATEFVMPPVEKLKLKPRFKNLYEKRPKRKASHEDYTIKAITDSSFTSSFKKCEEKFGINPYAIAELITGHTDDPDYFLYKGINYFPLLHQLVSSEMDCDRMDYLLRDSYFCGVNYGKYDLNWIIDNLKICPIDGQALLGISDQALVTFDDFLLSRFHMFLMVYFHYRPVCLEQLLMRYFDTSSNEYQIPSDIEAYIQHDDFMLMDILKKSPNPYAQRIIRNQIPPKVFESVGNQDLFIFNHLENYLKEQKIEYILCSSKSRLSKYYTQDEQRQKYAIKVLKQYPHGKKTYTNIEEATDLFQKYSDAYMVTRLYCSLEEMNVQQQKELFALMENAP